jgi:NAD(P)-dependent dehydrogenase (short-subunit alcohol dehydrogenase family)
MRVLITGATDGIGKATARALARAGHDIIIHGRNKEKLEAVEAELSPIGEGAVDSISADLASLLEVANLSDEIASRFPDLSVVINNAGIMTRDRQESRDGIELNFAVNHLAPLLLSLRLRTTLAANAPSRLIFVSSMVHETATIDLNDLESVRSYDGMAAYSASKLANVYTTRILADRYRSEGITVNALHPGVIDTKLLHVYFSGGSSVDRGAETSVYLATSPEVADTTGRYFSRSAEAATPALADERRSEALELFEKSIERIRSVSADFVPDMR